MALTQLKTSGIADDAVTTDKLANAINTERTANTAKSTNATHTGEVTGSGALTITDDTVDEANLKISNSPTNGYFLSAQSGNTGGLTWAQVTTDLVGDTSPQLGGDLDTNSHNISLDDNHKVNFGDSNDLQIYHDGSHARIKNATGHIVISSDSLDITNAADNENLAKFDHDGAVQLYYDSNKKFETYANGCTVTGNLNASNVDLGDNALARFGTDNDAFIKHSGSDLFIENDTGGFNIKCTSGTGVGEGVITFSSGAGSSEAMRINAEGDLQMNQTANDCRLGIKQRSSEVHFIDCRDTSGTLKFYCHSSGNTYNTNGSYGQISDQSLKENIVDAKSQWNDIKNIKIRNFNFTKASGMGTHTQIGCVAQEVEKVSPKLVTAPRSDGIKTVVNSVLYMKAIKALQEAMAKIETLETKVAVLEAA